MLLDPTGAAKTFARARLENNIHVWQMLSFSHYRYKKGGTGIKIYGKDLLLKYSNANILNLQLSMI